MRFLLDRHRPLLFVCLFSAARIASACDQLPAGQSLWIRLAAPISTYTAKPGDPIRAILTQDLLCENEVVLPMGTSIDGVVRSARKVGWGIQHETAALTLDFNNAHAASGKDLPISTRVDEIENAREQVRKGVIQGVRSTNTFQGSVNSRLIHLPTWNPYSDPVLIVYKAVFPIFPEPEIYYPVGTDIHLKTTSELSLPTSFAVEDHQSPHPTIPESEQLDQLVEQLPARVVTKKSVDADIINILFIGSAQQVTEAFHDAGWQNADPVSRRTVAKNLYALLNNSGYPQEPMTTFFLDGRPEDMNWQKSLNSYDRRDHLRIWQWDQGTNSDPVWISSSTHDTHAALGIKHLGFVHHISPNIDDERATVIRDLNFAGCVSSVNYISRPQMSTTAHNAIGDSMHTDGSIAVVSLQDCHPGLQLDPTPKGGNYKPGNVTFRYIRRQILTFRSDIFRANIIYGAYDAGRMTIAALRRPAKVDR
jgi:hypothetical protein